MLSAGSVRPAWARRWRFPVNDTERQTRDSMIQIAREVEDIQKRIGKLPALIAGVDSFIKAGELKEALSEAVDKLEN